MTDIVERIQNRLHDAPMPTEHLLDEAATEIEQLRADLAQALADGEHMVVMLAEAVDQIRHWQALAEKRSVSKKLILP